MNRREFTLAATSALALTALGLPSGLFAQSNVPQDGVHYLTLDKRVNTDAPAGKIEVIEFFWYSCPHCNAFEPKLVNWIKRLPADVTMRRIPAGFRDDMVPQQRMFYALEAMGKIDELHPKIFNAIHVEHQALDRSQLIADWVAKQGVDAAKFKEAYESFAVSAKARRATQIQDAYKVDGVPALGIAGRYYTDGTLAGNADRSLVVADYLLAQVRKGA